jgi:hypothetical protein
MPEETCDEKARSRQSEHNAYRQHDHGDAKAQADDHEHESQDDDGEVLQERTRFAKQPTDAKGECHDGLPR